MKDSTPSEMALVLYMNYWGLCRARRTDILEMFLAQPPRTRARWECLASAVEGLVP